jgi:hypothetical protein
MLVSTSSADLEGKLTRTGRYIIQHFAVISRTRKEYPKFGQVKEMLRKCISKSPDQ